MQTSARSLGTRRCAYFHTPSIGAEALASCTSSPVQLAVDRCWSVSVGDKVEGTAVLLAHKPGDGCIEWRASLSARNCTGVGLMAPAGAAAQMYDHIVLTAPADQNGFIQQIVYLSGKVVPSAATGMPMVRAEQLRLPHQASRATDRQIFTSSRHLRPE
jgi:hypothetical protein